MSNDADRGATVWIPIRGMSMSAKRSHAGNAIHADGVLIVRMSGGEAELIANLDSYLGGAHIKLTKASAAAIIASLHDIYPSLKEPA